jgi:DNA-directed RNA polymerase alpha subunit
MKPVSDFPPTMGKVAPRELVANGIHTLEQTTRYTEQELLSIHGVGPKAVRIIKEELAKKNLHLKKST